MARPATAAVGVATARTTSGIGAPVVAVFAGGETQNPDAPEGRSTIPGEMVAVPARAQVRLRQLTLSRWTVGIVLVGAAGIAARVWVYRSILGVPSSDDALVGLWTRHAAHGDFTTFFWGLHYGGTQEALLSVPLFLVFGSSWLALKIVPIVLSGVTALLVWRVGRRTIGEFRGAVAAAIFWIWPAYVLSSTSRPGFYASDIFYCSLLLLLALRIVERPDRTRVAVFGLVLGVAYWETSQVVPIAVPLIAWTIWKQPRALRHIWIAAPLAIVGSLPWLVWNLRHDFGSLTMLSYDVQSSYAHRLRIFFSPLLLMIMGLRQPFTQALVLPWELSNAVYLVLLGLFAYGFVKTRRTNASVLYVVALVFPFLYAISAWTVESSDPRYLIVLTPVLALLLAQLAVRPWLGVALVVAAAALSATVLHTLAHNAELNEQAAPTVPNDFHPLIRTLDRLGVHYVYSTHWIAYRLAFESNERIIGVKNDFTSVTFSHGQAQPSIHFVRYPPYERRVREGRHAFIFYKSALSSIPIVKPLVRYGYRPHTVSGLVIYTLPASR
jgi:Dolichyl-phosphate-mannose-protein mannosyltransferase